MTDIRRMAVGSLNGMPMSLDPAGIVDSSQWHTLANLGINLVTHDRHGQLLGEGAHAWKVSDDFRNFSFELVRGLKDSGGHELDSEDWRQTFLHLLRSGGSTHSFIVNFLDERGIQTPSRWRLVLSLRQPYQTFIERLTTPEFILLPRSAIKRNNRVEFSVSSGPYYTLQWEPSKGICILGANHHHAHYSPAQVDRVRILPMPTETKTLFKDIASGVWNFSLLQMIPTDPSRVELNRLIETNQVRISTTELRSVGFVLLFDSPRLQTTGSRMAIAKILTDVARADMDKLGAAPARQIYPPGFVGSVSPEQEEGFMERIGKGSRGQPLPQKLIGYASHGVVAYGLASWVQKSLALRGVKVEIRELPYADYQKKRKGIDHDLVVVMTGMNAKDPAGSLLTLISPKSGIVPDPEGALSSLLEKSVEATRQSRASILHSVTETLVGSARIVPIVHYGGGVLSSRNLDAHPPSRFDDDIRLADMRWTE